MRILGIIPARGGSKGIPRKNIQLLCGKPLLQYTAEAALSSKRLSRVILSTEDEEIAGVGRRCGLEVPFMRPRDLAQDHTLTLPVLQHAVRCLEERGDRYDAVCLLQPTCPLRRAGDIDGAIEQLEHSGADSVISAVDVGENHPSRMMFVDTNGRSVSLPLPKAFQVTRRQDLPKVYLREGSLYITRRNILMDGSSLYGQDCRVWIMPVERVCNVNCAFDLFLAGQLLEYYGSKQP